MLKSAACIAISLPALAADQAPSADKTGNPSCWNERFDWASCCDSSFGPGGNGACWDGAYSHELCCGSQCLRSLRANAAKFAHASTWFESVDGGFFTARPRARPAICRALRGRTFAAQAWTAAGLRLVLDLCAPADCGEGDVRAIAEEMYGRVVGDLSGAEGHAVTYGEPLLRLAARGPRLTAAATSMLLALASLGGGVRDLARGCEGQAAIHWARLAGTAWIVTAHTVITVPFDGLPFPSGSGARKQPLPQWYTLAWDTVNYANYLFGFLAAYCTLISTWAHWRHQSLGKRLRSLARKLASTWCRLVPTLLLHTAVRGFVNPLLSLQRYEAASESWWGLMRTKLDDQVHQHWPGLPLLLPYAFRDLRALRAHGPQQPLIYVHMFEIVVLCSLVVFLACGVAQRLQRPAAAALALATALALKGAGHTRIVGFSMECFAAAVVLDGIGSTFKCAKSERADAKRLAGRVARAILTPMLLGFPTWAVCAQWAWALEALGLCLLFLMQLWSEWRAESRAAKLSYAVNVMHSEWFTFWLVSWGMGGQPLPPCFAAAASMVLLTMAISFGAAALLYVCAIYPMERALHGMLVSNLG